jgi:hypothetical protein
MIVSLRRAFDSIQIEGIAERPRIPYPTAIKMDLVVQLGGKKVLEGVELASQLEPPCILGLRRGACTPTSMA